MKKTLYAVPFVALTALAGACGPKHKKDVQNIAPLTSQSTPIPSSPKVDETLDFIVKNYQDSRILVGDTAPGSDVIGAVDIMQAIQAKLQNGAKLSPSFAQLVSEATQDPYGKNEILIGKPGNNSIADSVRAGQPALPADTGVLEAYILQSGKKAIVVTGLDDYSVRKAARALANQSTYDLKGSVVYVTGKDLENLQTNIVK